IYGVFCGIAFAVFRNQLPRLFNDNAEVLQLAALLLLFAALFQISDATQALGAGLLRGIKDVKTPTLIITVAYWVIGLPSGYIMTFILGMGPKGIWLGFILALSFASLLLIARFLRIAKKNSMATKQ